MDKKMLEGSIERLLVHLDRAYASGNYENVNFTLCSLLELYVRLGMKRKDAKTIEEVL